MDIGYKQKQPNSTCLGLLVCTFVYLKLHLVAQMESKVRRSVAPRSIELRSTTSAQNTSPVTFIDFQQEIQSVRQRMHAIETETEHVIATELQAQKQDLSHYVDQMMSFLKLNTNVLRLKMNTYKACDVRVQTSLLCGSALISFLTGFRVMYDAFAYTAESQVGRRLQTSNSSSSAFGLAPGETLAFEVVVFVIAATMGLLAAITKFIGRKDKGDAMAAVVYKAAAVTSDLPQVQQQLKRVQTNEQFQALQQAFINREFKMWIDSIRAIGMHMSLESLTDHLPDFYELSLRNLRNQALYESSVAETIQATTTASATPTNI